MVPPSAPATRRFEEVNEVVALSSLLWYQAYILWVGRKQQGAPVSVPTIQYSNYIPCLYVLKS